MLLLHVLSQCIYKFKQKSQGEKGQEVIEDLEILSNPTIEIITIDNYTKWKYHFWQKKIHRNANISDKHVIIPANYIFEKDVLMLPR